MSSEDFNEDPDELRARMSVLPYESPVVEFERRNAERKSRARRRVALATAFAVIFQTVAAFFLWLESAFIEGVSRQDADTACFVFWCLSAVCAACGGVTTLRRSSMLSWWWILFGLLPWAAIVAEMLYALKILMSFDGFRA